MLISNKFIFLGFLFISYLNYILTLFIIILVVSLCIYHVVSCLHLFWKCLILSCSSLHVTENSSLGMERTSMPMHTLFSLTKDYFPLWQDWWNPSDSMRFKLIISSSESNNNLSITSTEAVILNRNDFILFQAVFLGDCSYLIHFLSIAAYSHRVDAQ